MLSIKNFLLHKQHGFLGLFSSSNDVLQQFHDELSILKNGDEYTSRPGTEEGACDGPNHPSIQDPKDRVTMVTDQGLRCSYCYHWRLPTAFDYLLDKTGKASIHMRVQTGDFSKISAAMKREKFVARCKILASIRAPLQPTRPVEWHAVLRGLLYIGCGPS